jgi:hypothetical protein
VESLGSPLENLTVSQLKSLCTILELSKHGNKSEIFARIWTVIEDMLDDEEGYSILVKEVKDLFKDKEPESIHKQDDKEIPAHDSDSDSVIEENHAGVDLSKFEVENEGTNISSSLKNYLFPSSSDEKGFNFFGNAIPVDKRKEILKQHEKFNQLPKDAPIMTPLLQKKLTKGAKAREEELLNLQRRTLDILTPLVTLGEILLDSLPTQKLLWGKALKHAVQLTTVVQENLSKLRKQNSLRAVAGSQATSFLPSSKRTRDQLFDEETLSQIKENKKLKKIFDSEKKENFANRTTFRSSGNRNYSFRNSKFNNTRRPPFRKQFTNFNSNSHRQVSFPQTNANQSTSQFKYNKYK